MSTMDCSLKAAYRIRSLRWIPAVLIFSFCLITPVQAQLNNFRDPLGGKVDRKESEKAIFVAKLTPSSAKPGDEVTLTISTKLPPHSYIYSTTGDFPGRTEITTKKIDGLEPLDADFQSDRKPETKFDDIFNQQVSKFYGDVVWSKRFRIAADSKAENVAINLELTGQYCSEGDGGLCTLLKPPVKLRATLSDKQVGDANMESNSIDPEKFKFSIRPKKGKTNPAELIFKLTPVESTGGKTVKLDITMVLDEGWHTFSTTFTGDGGTPTVIEFEKLFGISADGKGIVPNRPPEIKVEESLGLRQEVYHKEVTWSQEFELLPGTKPGHFGIEGSITYQTCRESCIPPRRVPFVLGDTSGEFAAAGKNDVSDVPHESNAAPAERSKNLKPQDKGLISFLFTAMLAAMVALLTPCVFPMVPITVSFFLKQNESKGGRPIVLAIVFSTAIVLAFVVIGVGIAAIFGATKPNELANNWILNLFLASIFFAFALNMLGAFEIAVPTWLLNFTATGEQTGGYVGVIFMALTFVLTSFSCTFAFVGSLLAAAAQGEYYWPILGMLAFGTTFAAPFFIMAMMPGMLKSLPKSGGWLNSVKVVMGFVELGVAVKYISIVDQQWNSIPWLFDFTNVMTLWSVLSFCTGLYLLGQFRLTHDTPVQGLSPVRVILSVGFLMLGGLFAVGLTQPQREAWMVDQLIAFAPSRLENDGFELNFDAGVARATEQTKPIFVDFTGVFCTNCRLMEKRMEKPHNQSRLKKFVKVQLYTDKVPKITDKAEASRILDRNVALQVNWFGDVTLPSYAVVTPDGKTILSMFTGLEQNEGDFAKFMDEGLEKWQASK